MHCLKRLLFPLVVKMVNGRSRTPRPRLRSWNASRLVCYAFPYIYNSEFQGSHCSAWLSRTCGGGTLDVTSFREIGAMSHPRRPEPFLPPTSLQIAMGIGHWSLYMNVFSGSANGLPRHPRPTRPPHPPTPFTSPVSTSHLRRKGWLSLSISKILKVGSPSCLSYPPRPITDRRSSRCWGAHVRCHLLHYLLQMFCEVYEEVMVA